MADGPASSPSRGGLLDSPPPEAPDQAAKAKGKSKTLMDTQTMGSKRGAGLGLEASNPQVVAMQSLAMIEQGTQLLSTALPALAPALSGLVTNLRQVIPQAMADQISGLGGASAGQPSGPIGGGAPSMPPPSGPPGVPAGAGPA